MKRKIRRNVGERIFDVANYTFLALMGLFTVGPFLYLVAGSLTEASYYRAVGVSFSPIHWSLDTYRILLGGGSRIYQALKVTVFITLVGTFVCLLVTAALAYGVSKRDLPGHNLFVTLIFFTMLFGGGMVPFYLVVKRLGLINTLWSLIIPMLVDPWYMFIMVKFFEALPRDLEDAARMDGCSEIAIFLRIVLPLSKPVLATVGLFYAVRHWNQWFWATIFLSKDRLLPLQLMLRDVLSQMLYVTDPDVADTMAQMRAQVQPPAQVLRMGAIVVTVLPIALVYPFLQKYFVKGVLVGSIKG